MLNKHTLNENSFYMILVYFSLRYRELTTAPCIYTRGLVTLKFNLPLG